MKKTNIILAVIKAVFVIIATSIASKATIDYSGEVETLSPEVAKVGILGLLILGLSIAIIVTTIIGIVKNSKAKDTLGIVGSSLILFAVIFDVLFIPTIAGVVCLVLSIKNEKKI